MPVDLASPPTPRPSDAADHPTWVIAALLFVVAVLAGCGEPSAGVPGSEGLTVSASRPGASGTGVEFGKGTQAVATDGRPLVSFLGDSITAGLHLPAEEAFPARLAERLAADGRPIRFVNAGLSGDTTSGGLRRLEWQLKQSPDILVVELGANDALRGQDLASVESNLRAIVQRGKSADAHVLLLGMKIPPNYGLDYTLGFEQLYQRIADEEDVPLIPFFMEDVVLQPGMMQSDGLHPTAAGHRVLADTVMPELVALIDAWEADRD